MRPLRIAFVIDTIETPAAGTERQLLALLQGLDRREFDRHLVCLRSSAWLAGATFDFPVTTCDIRSLRSGAALGAVLRFRRLCREASFDIVQTFFVDGNVFGTIGAALAGRPVVVSSRRNIGHWHGRSQVALLRLLRHVTGYYLANSRAVAEYTARVEGVPADRIEVIRNGLEIEPTDSIPAARRADQRAAWGVAPEEILAGTVANLRSIKNLPEFIDAAALALARAPLLKFVIVGEGPDRAELEQRIAGRGLAGRFLLAGRLLDVRPALAAFDIGVQCSRAESSSNSLIECMAAGLPVVVSDIPGNAEMVTPESTGLLYPLGEAAALADGLARLARDGAERARLGEAARVEARETYGMERCIERHAAFYRHILEGRRRS